MENIPRKYLGIVKRARKGLSRADSAHAQCLDCQGWLREAIRQCKNKECWWFHWRPYKTAQELQGCAKKRAMARQGRKKYPRRVSQVIEIMNPPEGRLRLRVEIEPETKKEK